MLVSCKSQVNWACLRLLLLLVFSANAVFCGTIVKYLPGFDGELPFKLETGYVTVDESELFYYFIESEGNSKKDPLLLWFSGGPGCSTFNGVIYEIGPLEFNIAAYEGGLPQLKYYPYSWTKAASVLFVDAPVGTGFSYATRPDDWPSSDTKSALQTYEFLKKWLIDHPQYLKVKLFVGVDSYSGLTGSIVVQHILNGNENGQEPRLNLQGYILGSPYLDKEMIYNSIITFSHRMALVSDELYEAAKQTCGDNYYNVSSSNAACYENIQLIEKCILDIETKYILEPKCVWASPESIEDSVRRSLQEDSKNLILSPFKNPDFGCWNFNHSLSYIWANDKSVRAALNIREGTVPYWMRCNKSIDYTFEITSVVDYHRNISKNVLQALLMSGDHDLKIPHLATIQFIKELNLPIYNDWKPWFVDGQVAGYTIKYSENGYHLTFATVKGAGHPAPEYKRKECYEMFNRFIHYYPI